MGNDSIEQLEARIADMKKQMPAHSVPMSMMLEQEELEEELENLRRSLNNGVERDRSREKE